MLIICSGADSFRARRKAQELEQAFRDKYDPVGLGVEHLPSGKEALEIILAKANAFSLFSPRRFFRVRGLLEDVPKAKHKALVQTLERDSEHVIIVSIEDEATSKTVLKGMEGVKIVSYDFPVLEGKDWQAWVSQEAQKNGVSDVAWIRGLANAALGDSWYVHGELAKAKSAGPSPISIDASPAGSFERADRFLTRSKNRYAGFGSDETSGGMNNIILSSVRSAVRVRDGAVTGMHPYVRQKLSRLRDDNWNGLLAASIISLVAARTSLCKDEESPSLFP